MKWFISVIALLVTGISLLLSGSIATQAAPTAVSSVYLPLVSLAVPQNNLLANHSFEQGWSHPNGIPELQVPAGWQFTWREGANPLDPEPWNQFVRPEVRVLPRHFLPEAERPLFIWHGDQTVKVFKGYGAIQFTLTRPVSLPPGTYTLEVSVYPDLVVDYVNNEKVFAPDPLSGEVRLLAGTAVTSWQLPAFGEKNRFWLTFTVERPSVISVGAEMRGRWAIRNNGWFMDDWRLYQH